MHKCGTPCLPDAFASTFHFLFSFLGRTLTGMVLMGFKPRSRLKDQYCVKKPYFLYPDESVVEGSTKLFYTMLLTLHEQNKVAICRLITMDRGEPRFVALLPQLEELDDHHNQLTPPGFHVITLPYAEEMRKVPHGEAQPEATRVSLASSSFFFLRDWGD